MWHTILIYAWKRLEKTIKTSEYLISCCDLNQCNKVTHHLSLTTIGGVWEVHTAWTGTTFTKCINDQQMHFNLSMYSYCIMFTNMLQPLLWPSSSNFFESKNTVIIKICLNHSTVLKTMSLVNMQCLIMR